MRSLIDSELKPPNITEWIAPILAHASIAIAASGLPFPDERSFVPGGAMQMAVQTILRDIQFAANKPLSERRLPFENGFPFLLPDEQFGSLLRPELYRI